MATINITDVVYSTFHNKNPPLWKCAWQTKSTPRGHSNQIRDAFLSSLPRKIIQMNGYESESAQIFSFDHTCPCPLRNPRNRPHRTIARKNGTRRNSKRSQETLKGRPREAYQYVPATSHGHDTNYVQETRTDMKTCKRTSDWHAGSSWQPWCSIFDTWLEWCSMWLWLIK